MNSRVQYATSTGEECIQKLTAPRNHCKRVISISEGFAFVSVIQIRKGDSSEMS